MRSVSIGQYWFSFGAYLGVTPGSSGLLEGDLGCSWVTGDPIAKEIGRTLPVTIELITISFSCWHFSFRFRWESLCALRPGGVADKVTFSYSLFAWIAAGIPGGACCSSICSSPSSAWPRRRWAGSIRCSTRKPPAVTGFITVDSLLAGNMTTFRDGVHHLMLLRPDQGVRGAVRPPS